MVQLLSTVANPVRVVGRGNLPDQILDCGPLGGILTAPDASEPEMNLIVAVDLPLLSPEFLKWFCSRLAGSSNVAVACRIGGNFPLCLGIHQKARSQIALKIAKGDLALRRFIREASAEILSQEEIRTAGFPDSLFRNFNTPEDWKQLNR